MGERSRRARTQQHAGSGSTTGPVPALQSNQEVLQSMPAAGVDPSYLDDRGVGVDRGTVGYRRGRVELAGTFQTLDGSGNVESRSGFGASADRDTFRATAEQSEGRGDDRRGGSAWVEVEHGAGRSGGAIGGSLHHGRNTYTAQGGRVISIGEPVQVAEGVYVVSGTVTTSLGVGGSAPLGAQASTGLTPDQQALAGMGNHSRPSLKLNVGVSGSQEVSFRQVFTGPNAAEQARRFQRLPDASTRRMRCPETLDEAMQLAPGERRGVENTLNENAGGALGSLVPLRLSGALQQQRGVEMERLDDRTLQISTQVSDSIDGSVGIAAAGTGMNFGGEHQEQTDVDYRIDLQHPNAAAIFAQLRAGQPPSGTSGPGWSRSRRRTLERTGTGVAAQLFGQDVDDREFEETEVIDTSRGREVRRRWNSDDTGVSTTSLQERRRSGEETDYQLRNRVRRDNFDLSEEALADISNGQDGIAMGSVPSRGLLDRIILPTEDSWIPGWDSSPAPNHEWTVESDFSQSQISDFQSHVVDASRPPDTLSPRLHADWEALAERLREDPHDTDAVGDFFQATGVEGMRAIRGTVGAPEEQYTSLGDGEVFMGREASKHTERTVSQLESSDLDVRQLRTLRLDLRRRLDAMSAEGSFPDLPGTLRGEERARLASWMIRLDQAEADHRASTRGSDTRSLNVEEGERATTLIEALTEGEQEAEEAPANPMTTMRANLDTTHQTLMSRRAEAHALWAAHNRLSEGATDTPRQRFTGGMTWLSGNAMNDGYERMQRLLSGADGQFSVAEESMQQSLSMQAEDLDALSPSALEGLQQMRNAQGFGRLSTRAYDEIIAGLRRMRAAQIAQQPGVWGVHEA